MRLLVGLGLDGPSFATLPSAASARLGEPAWGPTALLRDLELRLAVPDVSIPRSARVPQYAGRIRTLDDPDAFYRASFEVDPIGTAEALLALRDALVEGGWTGEAIRQGGERLAALARLETEVAAPLPRGDADRLAAVAGALVSTAQVYEEITLVEERTAWPGAWQRIFEALENAGTRFAAFRVDLPGAPAESDLGRLQSLIRGGPSARRDDLPHAIKGDGSLLVLRGETPIEVGALTAAMISTRPEGTVVVRSGDAHPLEAALSMHGLAGQGMTSASAWRPAMQVLPLAIELSFEPKDPYRALELLTLAVGPFRGIVGSRLARAVARSPGIGGREWSTRREEARELLREKEKRRLMLAGTSEAEAAVAADAHAATRLQRVTEWLEGAGVDPAGAPAAKIRDVAERVRMFLLTRFEEEPEVYGPAFAQAHAFVQALSHDEREVLSREETRQLLDTLVRSSHDHARTIERAGRVAHVADPSALLAPCDTVVFWSFLTEVERRPRLLFWNRAEREALWVAGVRLVDPSTALARQSEDWRRAILAARTRLLLVIPASTGGEASHPHSMWEEIGARLRLDGKATGRLTHEVSTILDRRAAIVDVDELPPLELPDPPGVWVLTPGAVALDPSAGAGSVTSLETLVTCPLAWVLEERADLRSGAVAMVARDAQLCGTLGHRLIEELFLEGAFTRAEDECVARAGELLSSLIEKEGATLRLPGTSFERAQLVEQLLRAVRELRRFLARSGLQIAAVEEPTETSCAVGTLSGRLDVRLVDPAGSSAILDLKWGESRYRALVEQGRAIQLAAYARALGMQSSGEPPPAGYFALRSGRVLTASPQMRAAQTIDGPTLDETWTRTEQTVRAVVDAARSGRVPVANARRSLPLLDALRIEAADRHRFYEAKPDAACSYCSFSAICGRAWEGLR